MLTENKSNNHKENIKVIFLDIDGVLNSLKWMMSTFKKDDPNHKDHIKRRNLNEKNNGTTY